MVTPNDVHCSSYVQMPDEMHITEKKINGFKDLEEGWHYGEGEVFDHVIIDMAIELHQVALNWGLFETDAFPGIDGEVGVIVYYGDQRLDFTVEYDGVVTFCYEVDNTEISYEEELLLEDAKKKIKEFGESLWNQPKSSGVYILNITTGGIGDLIPAHFEGAEVIVVSQSLLRSAYSNQEIPFVDISDPTPEEAQAPILYSVAFQQKQYHFPSS